MRANSIDVERGQNTLSIRMRSCAVYKSFVCNCDYQACARLQGVCVSVRMCIITYIVHVGERRRKWAH